LHFAKFLSIRSNFARLLLMSLSIGIVGLPNVGKSTLFNALTKKSVPCENYPFCTIDPSVGVVAVPDERLWKLSEFSHSKKTVPAAVEFVDIAGLVKGASEGEGLGNQFLSNIRETDAIAEVVRIFDDEKVHLVVTSPPYGDHRTTVAYGQFSKHPGLWLELPEEKLLDVDSTGIGGKKKKEISDLGSPLLEDTLQAVKQKDKELTKKTNNSNRAADVFSYFYDLDLCLEQISKFLKPDQSHCCFVVANRTVRRIKIPTDQIIVELGKKYSLKHKDTIYRTIANKAMSITFEKPIKTIASKNVINAATPKKCRRRTP